MNRIDWEEDIIKANSTNENHKMPAINSTVTTMSSEDISGRREEFIIVYLCMVLFGVMVYLCRSFSFYYMALRIATNLHDMLFRSIDRAKMIFFNANPSGRILNRFAKDMYRVDTSLPIILVDVINVSEKYEQGPLPHLKAAY